MSIKVAPCVIHISVNRLYFEKNTSELPGKSVTSQFEVKLTSQGAIMTPLIFPVHLRKIWFHATDNKIPDTKLSTYEYLYITCSGSDSKDVFIFEMHVLVPVQVQWGNHTNIIKHINEFYDDVVWIQQLPFLRFLW